MNSRELLLNLIEDFRAIKKEFTLDEKGLNVNAPYYLGKFVGTLKKYDYINEMICDQELANEKIKNQELKKTNLSIVLPENEETKPKKTKKKKETKSKDEVKPNKEEIKEPENKEVVEQKEEDKTKHMENVENALDEIVDDIQKDIKNEEKTEVKEVDATEATDNAVVNSIMEKIETNEVQEIKEQVEEKMSEEKGKQFSKEDIKNVDDLKKYLTENLGLKDNKVSAMVIFYEKLTGKIGKSHEDTLEMVLKKATK